MRDLFECFSQAPVFSRLSPQVRSELLTLAQRRMYEKDETICWQGDHWPRAAFIASGQLEWVMLSPDGCRQVVFKLGTCDVVWGHSFVDDLPMPASLEVREQAQVYLWDREVIWLFVSRSPQALWDITHVMVAYMRHVRQVVYGFAFHPVAGRLARLILDHYQPAEGEPMPRDLTLDQMAETVGTTRELVSRTLHRFADEGIVRVSRVELAFLDRKKLELLANGDVR